MMIICGGWTLEPAREYFDRGAGRPGKIEQLSSPFSMMQGIGKGVDRG